MHRPFKCVPSFGVFLSYFTAFCSRLLLMNRILDTDLTLLKTFLNHITNLNISLKNLIYDWWYNVYYSDRQSLSYCSWGYSCARELRKAIAKCLYYPKSPCWTFQKRSNHRNMPWVCAWTVVWLKQFRVVHCVACCHWKVCNSCLIKTAQRWSLCGVLLLKRVYYDRMGYTGIYDYGCLHYTGVPASLLRST